MKFRRTFALLVLLLLLLDCSRSFGQPHISSFFPTYASSNDVTYISIAGSGFSPGTLTVKFNGVASTDFGAPSSTNILARVPAGATNGANPIFVQVGLQSTFSSQNFLVIGP